MLMTLTQTGLHMHITATMVGGKVVLALQSSTQLRRNNLPNLSSAPSFPTNPPSAPTL